MYVLLYGNFSAHVLNVVLWLIIINKWHNIPRRVLFELTICPWPLLPVLDVSQIDFGASFCHGIIERANKNTLAATNLWASNLIPTVPLSTSSNSMLAHLRPYVLNKVNKGPGGRVKSALTV